MPPRRHGVWLDAGELGAIIGEKRKLEDVKDLGRLRAFLRTVGKRLRSA